MKKEEMMTFATAAADQAVTNQFGHQLVGELLSAADIDAIGGGDGASCWSGGMSYSMTPGSSYTQTGGQFTQSGGTYSMTC